jgi:hypothetical protein
MGYDAVGWSVAGRVSRHNSPKDKEDDELWDELVKRLEEVRDDPKFERLGLV